MYARHARLRLGRNLDRWSAGGKHAGHKDTEAQAAREKHTEANTLCDFSLPSSARLFRPTDAMVGVERACGKQPSVVEEGDTTAAEMHAVVAACDAAAEAVSCVMQAAHARLPHPRDKESRVVWEAHNDHGF